ncbi:hypothetical protein BGX26_000133 [Mortierella sp. AD094]|nr:hypothetical protein BGX26_000133 [Mortierella sp. AD094]
MAISQQYIRSTTSLMTLKILLFLAILCSVLAYPTSVTPIDDGSGITLDVGQRTVISNQDWALGVVFITIGLIEVFYGFKFVRLTLVVFGFLSWAVIAMVIMVAIRWDLFLTTFNPNYYYLWVWLSSGLTGAILCFRYWDVGVTFAGAFGGFALAMGIVAAANLSITNAARYIIMGVFILGGSAIATFFERVFVILATGFGGAYMFMFGVDQFTQVGYREMIVIFNFTGQTLTYHPSLAVYVMLASSLLLASLGIAWEFWHHETPLLMDRKAVFRIYGRPFGKHPKKLVGQRIHHHLKTKSDVYAYIIGCFCLQRWSIDDVLYNDDPEVCHPAPIQSPISESQPTGPQSGEGAKEHTPTTPLDGSGVPVKSAPMEDIDYAPQEGEKGSGSAVTIIMPSESSGSGTTRTEHKEQSETITTEHKEHTETTYSGSHSSAEQTADSNATPSTHPTEPYPEPYHPLFSPRLGERTVEMINLVTGDTSPGNTIPGEFHSRNHRVLAATSPHSIWPASSSTLNVASTVSHVVVEGLHMLEVSESSQSSHESEYSESIHDPQEAPGAGGSARGAA